MKKILIAVLLLSAIISVGSCIYTIAGARTLKGSGKLITQTVAAPSFDKVKASRSVTVIITDKVSDKLLIEADDNIMQYVTTEVKDSELKISIDKSIDRFDRVSVTVSVPANGHIRSLQASSAANIVTEVALSADEFELDASSAAKITAMVTARECTIDASSAARIIATVTSDECKIDASSASDIEADVTTSHCLADASSAAKIQLTGSAQNSTVEISSAASYRAPEFTVANYTIAASSGSNASILCTKELNASASSGASIRHAGEGTGNIRTSSGGSISSL